MPHPRLLTTLFAALIGACSDATTTATATSAGDASPDGADASVPSGEMTSGGVPIDAAVDAPPTGVVDPPLRASSKGSGGPAPVDGTPLTVQTITYRLIVPATYSGAATPLLIVFSGTEGGATMTQNLTSLGSSTKTEGMIRAVLDGVKYNGNGEAGATVLDEIRAKYNIDNDRTYLLGESAGTTAAMKLGFHLRQSSFAAYWANDVNATDAPQNSAGALGFSPHGQAGPGGDLQDATSIVAAMKSAGYRVPTPAPYDGPGSTQHGSPQQLIAAITFLADKNRN